MFRRKRKGMALITVVLISALLFVSIIGITLKVVPENKIIVARSSSERALTAAESGLSQVLFNLRNADFMTDTTAPSGMLEYLDIDDVKAIASQGVGYFLDLGEHSYSELTDIPYVTYWVKIKKTAGDTWTPTNVPSDEPHSVTLAIYSMGTVYSNSTKEVVIGRKVISTDCDVVFNKSVNTINFGILAGGNIALNGSSKETGGDIFANGDITSNNPQQKVFNGEAYAHGKIDGTIAPDDNRHEGQATVDISTKFEQYNKGMGWAFKTGNYPYDGTVVGYPDTRNSLVQLVIQDPIYLGPAGTSADMELGSTLEGIQKFYSDLMAGTGAFLALTPAQLTDLQTNAKSIVYYHQGDVTLNHGLPDLSNLKGIIVIDGDLKITGNATIGDSGNPDNPQFALIVRGTITKTAGTADFYGLLYGESFTMSAGDFNCYGAMVTEGDIEVTGNSTITFKDTDLNTVDVLKSNGVSTADEGASSWRETSWYEFKIVS